MADTDDTLMREVNEEFRREQYAKYWDKYGVLLLVAAALLVAGIVGFQYWQSNALKAAQTSGSKYQSALQLVGEGKSLEANKAFTQISKVAPKTYQILSQLKLAGALATAGKKAKAVTSFDAIVDDGGADEVLAGFARLQAAALRVGDADWTEMQNRLKPLTLDNGAWRFSASELLGVAAKRSGKTDKARKIYQELLIDRQVPPSIKARAKIMMSILTAEKLTSTEKTTGAISSGKKTSDKAIKPGSTTN